MTLPNTVGTIIGLLIASVLDITVFVAIAAIPLSALVFLSVMSQSAAILILQVVAIIAVLRVVIVSVMDA